VTLLICTFLPVRKKCLKVESSIALLPEYLIWLSAIRSTLRSVAPSILLFEAVDSVIEEARKGNDTERKANGFHDEILEMWDNIAYEQLRGLFET
jgi:hypothetical protein